MTSISGRPDPVVRVITHADIVAALTKGMNDFQAAPLYGVMFGGIYAAGGLLILACATTLGMGYLVYPLAAGFVLIGPYVAVGLYEVSRRRETGEPLSFKAVWGVMINRREIAWMAFVTLFVFIIWMYQVRLLLALFLGINASFANLEQFVTVVLTTPEGLLFLAIGHVIGAILALMLFSLTVVSFPLLLDRDLDFVTAMITSLRAVTKSPLPMLGWAAVIVFQLVISIVPFFLGLLITLPVLGHATWHLYRRAVLPQGQIDDAAETANAARGLYARRSSEAVPLTPE
jgi:uncharacterized membrane protein